ncbi:hypothetical protein EGR_06804 [Echinococcus granulosus]|uniref:Uncharacterized protein n=1 Tax=Echinococcus granulosus TaxID=6210 RepID=W6UJV3_ECHGR|nr:hypothetical protein EGR_06804 [Echinococcus granulosus]EUB58397.1 hypothetical protein EGR_06804 [Echinococcus granulosus]
MLSAIKLLTNRSTIFQTILPPLSKRQLINAANVPPSVCQEVGMDSTSTMDLGVTTEEWCRKSTGCVEASAYPMEVQTVEIEEVIYLDVSLIYAYFCLNCLIY